MTTAEISAAAAFPAPPGADACAARFGRVPARWLGHPAIGLDELAVLTALTVHADRSGVCVVRQRTLAGLLKRSREWVCRVITRLCGLGGFLDREHRTDRDGWNLACRYRLPDLAAVGEPDTVDVVEPPSAAVSRPVTAAVTDDAPQEQRIKNTESSTPGQRCAGDHSREPGSGSDRDTARDRLAPADWQPSAEDRAWLAEHRPDLDARIMTAIFVCGCRARGLRYADLSAAWRRWALAERSPTRRSTASASASGYAFTSASTSPSTADAAPPRGRNWTDRQAARQARNQAVGSQVLARMLARRGEAPEDRPEV
jgi:hypothetical protein